MTEDARNKPVRETLMICRELTGIIKKLESAGFIVEPLNEILGNLAAVIWAMYEITLAPGQCEYDGFHDVIFEYGDGELEIEECLSQLAQFATTCAN